MKMNPKNRLMPDKEEAKSPFVMKKYETRVEIILLQERKI
jgi:hypothetical protein